jgi:hypothetical protein
MISLTILYYVLIYFLLLSITYSLTKEIKYTTSSSYATNATTFMPVTTRSRAKLLRDELPEPTILILPDSVLPSTSSTKFSLITPNTATVPNISDTVLIATVPKYHETHHSPDIISLSLEESYFEISNFQTKSQTTCETEPDPLDVLLSTKLCHNLSISKNIIMEADCEDIKPLPTSSLTSSDPMDKIQQLFTSLSAQIERQNLNLSRDFCQLVQDNTTFKQEVHEELDEIRQILCQRNVANLSSSPTLHTVPNLPLNSVSQDPSSTPNQSTSPPVPQGLSSSVASSSSTDMQTQMMYLLTESFSKLSAALLDKSSDTKSEWPKFSGDSKKFRSWYLAIIAQLSLPPWQELYDSIKHDVVPSTSNAALNGKLYAKLLLSLEGIASQNIISRTHLRANGVLLLQELVQTYRPKNVPEVIAAKTSQFWGQTKCLSNESTIGFMSYYRNY